MSFQLDQEKTHAKRANARIKPLKGIFQTLAKEHREAASLLREFAATSDEGVREQMLPHLRAELLSHEQAELSVLYPVLRRYEATRRIADDHQREAEELSVTVEQVVAQASLTSPACHALVEDLLQQLELHAKREETEFFPIAQHTLGEPFTDELDARYQEKRRAIREMLR